MGIPRRRFIQKILKTMGWGGLGVFLDPSLRVLSDSIQLDEMAIASNSELSPISLANIDANIQKHRTATLEIQVLSQGQSISGQKVKVQHIRHLFKFGAAYHRDLSERPNESEIDRRDRTNFLQLFNAATVTFYWATYEPKHGEFQDRPLLQQINWLKKHNLSVRGHPLFWNHNPACLPSWLKEDRGSSSQIRELMDKTLEHMSANIFPYLENVDVFNELVNWEFYEHPLTKLIAAEGKVKVATEYLQKFKKLNPNVKAAINDFSTKPLYAQLLKDLLISGAPIDAIAQQSHMHRGNWDLELVGEILERLSQLGKPIIWSELSVLSGDIKPDLDYSKTYSDWKTNPQGEQRQSDYLERLYRLIYSHPLTEGIYLWDYGDRYAWLGAPVGILNLDGSPKPAFTALDTLINKTWRTNGEFTTDAEGKISISNTYAGEYTFNTLGKSFKGIHSCKQPLKITLKL